MELRTILYGYRKEHLVYYIVPDECDVVRRIFREYISGKTMRQIADDLTSDHVYYYKEKCVWTKNAVCRILENEHYIGDLEYPAIISRTDFMTANTIKAEKGGVRESDTPDVAWLKRKVICAECGRRFTLRKNYRGSIGRWECSDHCGTSFSLLDTALYSKLIKIINHVIDDPDILRYSDYHTDTYNPPLDLIRSDREIDRMIEQKDPQFLPIKIAIYETASMRFDCCRFDPSKAFTDKLIEYIRTVEKSKTLDIALMDLIVKEIIVNSDGTLSVRFSNDRIINEQEIDCNADNSDKS